MLLREIVPASILGSKEGLALVIQGDLDPAFADDLLRTQRKPGVVQPPGRAVGRCRNPSLPADGNEPAVTEGDREEIAAGTRPPPDLAVRRGSEHATDARDKYAWSPRRPPGFRVRFAGVLPPRNAVGGTECVPPLVRDDDPAVSPRGHLGNRHADQRKRSERAGCGSPNHEQWDLLPRLETTEPAGRWRRSRWGWDSRR